MTDGAGHPDDVRGHDDGECEGGKPYGGHELADARFRAVQDDRREPRQGDREAEHQDGGDDELGDAHPDQADRGDHMVRPAVAVQAREDAEDDRAGDGEEDGHQGDERGVAEVQADFAADRLAGHEGEAEVAVQGAADPVDVPLPGGLVEFQFLAEGGDGVRRSRPCRGPGWRRRRAGPVRRGRRGRRRGTACRSRRRLCGP